MFHCCEYVHTNTPSTRGRYRYLERSSEDFKVWVNGKEAQVYTCRISKMPFNTPWPGYQRPIDQTELASFVSIVSDEAVTREVEVLNREYKEFMLRPYSKNIPVEKKDGKLVFTLERDGQHVLALDDLHKPLFIFNSRPIEAPDPETVTYYFGPGIHAVEKIILHDNESVYVDKDALVYSCIFAENANNIRIFGNGLLDDSREERQLPACYEPYTNGNIKFYDCQNIKLEGVLLRNSAMWCVNFFHCFDAEVDGIKVFGQWRYNTDGVDIVNSQRITMRNSFIHSFDDTIVIKGIDRYIDTDNCDMLFENCVLWCDWGKTCEIGIETACRECYNITFRGCDIIRGGNTHLDIQNGDCAEIHHIFYEDINAEYNSCDTEPSVQWTPEQKYPENPKMAVPWLINIVNYRFRTPERCVDGNPYKTPLHHSPLDLDGIQQATVHDITYRNITVYYDERIPKVDGRFNTPICVHSCIEGVKHYNISVSGVKINGVPANENNVVMQVWSAENFTFTED